jgi:hypothetical protein
VVLANNGWMVSDLSLDLSDATVDEEFYAGDRVHANSTIAEFVGLGATEGANGLP